MIVYAFDLSIIENMPDILETTFGMKIITESTIEAQLTDLKFMTIVNMHLCIIIIYMFKYM